MADQIAIGSLFTPPTPQQCTERTLADALVGAASVNLSTLENLERIIWANPWGLSAQEVFDLLGQRAGQLLALKAALLPRLAAAASAAKSRPPIELKPEGVTLTVSDDGTVRVA